MLLAALRVQWAEHWEINLRNRYPVSVFKMAENLNQSINNISTGRKCRQYDGISAFLMCAHGSGIQ